LFRQRRRPEQRPAFVHGLLPLLFRNGIGDDAATGLNMQHPILENGGANGDGGIHIAGPRQIADRAGVNPALDRLQFVDDLHRPILGAPLTVPAGKVARSASMVRSVPGRNRPVTLETMCMTCE
jgi:hypothetical protein